MSQKNTEKDQFPTHSDRKSEGAQSAQIRIITWRENAEPATFYIQSKGKHAGRPLREPIANCWAVYSDIPQLKAIAFSIYVSGHLRTNLLGSVVPFLRISEYRPILTKAAMLAGEYDKKHLKTLEFLQDQIGSFETKLELFRSFQTVLAYKINQELKIFRRA